MQISSNATQKILPLYPTSFHFMFDVIFHLMLHFGGYMSPYTPQRCLGFPFHCPCSFPFDSPLVGYNIPIQPNTYPRDHYHRPGLEALDRLLSQAKVSSDYRYLTQVPVQRATGQYMERSLFGANGWRHPSAAERGQGLGLQSPLSRWNMTLGML